MVGDILHKTFVLAQWPKLNIDDIDVVISSILFFSGSGLCCKEDSISLERGSHYATSKTQQHSPSIGHVGGYSNA